MQAGEGIITKPSKYSAAETLERLADSALAWP